MNLQTAYDTIDDRFNSYLEEIRAYLRMTGVSTSGEGIRETAEYTADLIRRIGGTAELVETQGNPVVFGKVASAQPDAKTLIKYSLYDVVPVEEDAWITPPFGASIVDAKAHPGLAWDICEGSILVGRGARNQRGPNLAFMLTLDAMRDSLGDIPANILFTIDGEEELASPNWAQFLNAKEDELLQAHGAYTHGFRQDESGTHMLYLGMKGVSLFELRVEGGEWGGTLDGSDLGPGDMVWVDAPAHILVRAVESLFDAMGRCAIDGFWENVRPDSASEIEIYAALSAGFDEEGAKRSRNIARFRSHKPAAELAADYSRSPVLNIDGLVSGYTTEEFTTVLPMRASAKFDVRLVPDQSLDEFYGLLRAHLDARGFEMVQVIRKGGLEPGKTDPGDPLVSAAVQATEDFGIGHQLWPISHAGSPLAFYARPPFNLPILNAGIGFSGKAHMPNEWASVPSIKDSMKWTAAFLSAWSRL